MKILRNPSLLDDWMRYRQTNGGQLGRLAGVSRQFIHQLRSGQRDSCADATADAIEVALNIPPGALFRAAPATAPARATTAGARPPRAPQSKTTRAA